MQERVRNFAHAYVRPDSRLAAMEEWIRETYDIPETAIEGVFYQDMATHPHSNLYEIRLTSGIEVETLREIADRRGDLTYEMNTGSDGTPHLSLLDVDRIDGESRAATSKATFADGCTTVGISFISEDPPFEVGDAVDNTLESLQLYFNAR